LRVRARSCERSCAQANSITVWVEMEVREKNFPTIEFAGPNGRGRDGHQHERYLGNMFQGRSKRRKMRVDEAMEYLMQEEEERLIRYGYRRARLA